MPKITLQPRALTALLLAGSLIFMALGGLVLFIAPWGPMARNLGWTFLGLSKGDWESVHVIFGILFPIAACFHIYFNKKSIGIYMKDATIRLCGVLPKLKNELLVALGVVFLLFVGAVWEIPPVSSILSLREAITHGWGGAQTPQAMQGLAKPPTAP